VEIKYHLDEHIDAAVAAGLRLRGVDVTTTVEQELQGASDLQQLAFAHAQGRVLVTCDSDFIVLSKERRRAAGA
jgi:predicted nuclease of predicted toxin-antitoxin system